MNKKLLAYFKMDGKNATLIKYSIEGMKKSRSQNKIKKKEERKKKSKQKYLHT